MLLELRIKNLATIDRVELSLEPGFNVITGETGAGKSMLVQAVQLLAGAKGEAELLRTGASEALVEARFFAPHLSSWLQDHGLEPGEEIVLRRILGQSGRSRAYLNDQAVTLKLLGNLVQQLVSLAGQHEQQSFLAPDNFLTILDTYAGLATKVDIYRQQWQEWRRRQQEWQQLTERRAALEQRRELLQFQIQELERAALQPGEEEELAREQERLRHAEQLWEAARQAYDRLYGDKNAVLSVLGEVEKLLTQISRHDPVWGQRTQILPGLKVELEDLALALRDYLSQIRPDPIRLEAVEQRLQLLQRLQRKYAAPIPDLMAYLAQARQELASLDDLNWQAEKLARELAAAAQETRQLADALSRDRQKAAAAFAVAVEQEIHQLAMAQARFLVHLEAGADLGPRGRDRVAFLWAPNPGEEPRPLARIASGGELSRLVLALKSLLAEEAAAATLIFDEVDTGIGGAVATVVGAKLRRLAQRQQIICITHLPQIACFAETHFRVSKEIARGRTTTAVEKLPPRARSAELARMLGGALVTATTLSQAEEMIQAAQKSVETTSLGTTPPRTSCGSP